MATISEDAYTIIRTEESFTERLNELTVEFHQGLNITDLLFDFYNSSNNKTTGE